MLKINWTLRRVDIRPGLEIIRSSVALWESTVATPEQLANWREWAPGERFIAHAALMPNSTKVRVELHGRRVKDREWGRDTLFLTRQDVAQNDWTERYLEAIGLQLVLSLETYGDCACGPLVKCMSHGGYPDD